MNFVSNVFKKYIQGDAKPVDSSRSKVEEKTDNTERGQTKLSEVPEEISQHSSNAKTIFLQETTPILNFLPSSEAGTSPNVQFAKHKRKDLQERNSKQIDEYHQSFSPESSRLSEAVSTSPNRTVTMQHELESDACAEQAKDKSIIESNVLEGNKLDTKRCFGHKSLEEKNNNAAPYNFEIPVNLNMILQNKKGPESEQPLLKEKTDKLETSNKHGSAKSETNPEESDISNGIQQETQSGFSIHKSEKTMEHPNITKLFTITNKENECTPEIQNIRNKSQPKKELQKKSLLIERQKVDTKEKNTDGLQNGDNNETALSSRDQSDNYDDNLKNTTSNVNRASQIPINHLENNQTTICTEDPDKAAATNEHVDNQPKEKSDMSKDILEKIKIENEICKSSSTNEINGSETIAVTKNKDGNATENTMKPNPGIIPEQEAKSINETKSENIDNKAEDVTNKIIIEHSHCTSSNNIAENNLPETIQRCSENVNKVLSKECENTININSDNIDNNKTNTDINNKMMMDVTSNKDTYKFVPTNECPESQQHISVEIKGKIENTLEKSADIRTQASTKYIDIKQKNDTNETVTETEDLTNKTVEQGRDIDSALLVIQNKSKSSEDTNKKLQEESLKIIKTENNDIQVSDKVFVDNNISNSISIYNEKKAITEDIQRIKQPIEQKTENLVEISLDIDVPNLENKLTTEDTQRTEQHTEQKTKDSNGNRNQSEFEKNQDSNIIIPKEEAKVIEVLTNDEKSVNEKHIENLPGALTNCSSVIVTDKETSNKYTDITKIRSEENINLEIETKYAKVDKQKDIPSCSKENIAQASVKNNYKENSLMQVDNKVKKAESDMVVGRSQEDLSKNDEGVGGNQDINSNEDIEISKDTSENIEETSNLEKNINEGIGVTIPTIKSNEPPAECCVKENKDIQLKTDNKVNSNITRNLVNNIEIQSVNCDNDNNCTDIKDQIFMSSVSTDNPPTEQDKMDETQSWRTEKKLSSENETLVINRNTPDPVIDVNKDLVANQNNLTLINPESVSDKRACGTGMSNVNNTNLMKTNENLLNCREKIEKTIPNIQENISGVDFIQVQDIDEVVESLSHKQLVLNKETSKKLESSTKIPFNNETLVNTVLVENTLTSNENFKQVKTEFDREKYKYNTDKSDQLGLPENIENENNNLELTTDINEEAFIDKVATRYPVNRVNFNESSIIIRDFDESDSVQDGNGCEVTYRDDDAPVYSLQKTNERNERPNEVECDSVRDSAADLMVEKYRELAKLYEGVIRKQAKELEILKEKCETSNRLFTNTEMAFSDLYLKYQKSREAIEAYKENEDKLLYNIESTEDQIDKVNTIYETMSACVQDQINEATKEVAKEKQSLDFDITKLESTLKRMKIKVLSLENSLKQKTQECQALSAFWEDMAGCRH